MAAIQPMELMGNYPALVTPLHADGRVHTLKMYRIAERLLQADVTGLLVCGTTGQSATLDSSEQIALTEMVSDIVKRYDKQLIAAAGSNNTEEAFKLQRGIEDRLGPTTFLHVTGYYNNPPQEGLIKHFRKLLDSRVYEESNIIMYNVPGRTGCNMEAWTAAYLSTLPGLIGTKEASGNLDQVQSIIDGTDPDEFRVMSGEDHLVSKLGRMGGYGVISASANIAPKPYNDMVEAGLRGDYDEAERIQEWIMPIRDVIFNEKNPIPLAEVFSTCLRSPMTTYDEGLDILEDVMNSLRIRDNPEHMEKVQNRIEELGSDKKAVLDVIGRYTPQELGMDYKEFI